jgi:cytidine deaminase
MEPRRKPTVPETLAALTPIQQQLSDEAWRVREKSHIYGATQVGCAVLTAQGVTFSGCNVEHRYRSHDVHAEVNALTTMVSRGHIELAEVWIAAERERFTPCGACLDWIIQFGGPDVGVVVQAAPDLAAVRYLASELMPYYPK